MNISNSYMLKNKHMGGNGNANNSFNFNPRSSQNNLSLNIGNNNSKLHSSREYSNFTIKN